MPKKPEVLATKLFRPPMRAAVVSRPRLLQRLDDVLSARLGLVSAPAGFGKTTLLAEWASSLARRDDGVTIRQGWLSMDVEDNEPTRFMTYLVEALEMALPGVASETRVMLQSLQRPPMRSFLLGLINRLAASQSPLVLVLDDYHLIEEPSIHDGLGFLVDNIPPQVHLIVASRTEPPIALPRLRARRELVELHESDLRFTLDEAVDFLNGVMGLSLSRERVAALERRTEGWVAGLQLAAVSMAGHDDVDSFLAAFTGSSRYVFDYLADEVLRRLPGETQRFLLLTSVLDRLTGSLCDAVLGRADSQSVLEKLEADNLFLVALDQDRLWYRYHRLFAEFLRARLRQAPPSAYPEGTEGSIETLHARASQWYGDQGQLDGAVGQALLARAYERAAHLIESDVLGMIMRGGAGPLLRWLGELPRTTVRTHPRLCLAYAWALTVGGQLEAVFPWLDEALAVIPANDPALVGEERAVRAMVTTLVGDVPAAIELAHQALDSLPTGDLLMRGMVSMNLGRAYDIVGDVDAAGKAYRQALDLSERDDSPIVHLMSLVQLAGIKELQGRLEEAIDTFLQALQPGAAGPLMLVAGVAHSGLARILYEQNHMDEAAHRLETCLEIGRRWDSDDVSLTGLVYLGRVRVAQGRFEEARSLSQQAEGRLEGVFVSPATIATAKGYLGRIWLGMSWQEAVQRWVEKYDGGLYGMSAETRHLGAATLARCWLYLGKPEAARDTVAEMLRCSRGSGRTAEEIEAVMLSSLVQEALGNHNEALSSLRQALQTAEAGGYVRLFVDEGTPMPSLLRILGPEIPYAARLLQVTEGDAAPAVERPFPSPRQAAAAGMVEPLSERELQVLGLLAMGHTNREIGELLVISVGTVKRHVSNIHGKLNVKTRTQAVARARQLGLC